ncbi:MAG TPA: signal recognition particle-docking protein FtsY [Clostridia bacterium]|nr:signal recognition particle-docking protein FtsY [Clostridia bacterium]
MGFIGRLKENLEKTREGFSKKVENLFSRYKSLDDELFEELEELLIMADVGVETSLELVENIRELAVEKRLRDPGELKSVFKEEIKKILQGEDSPGDDVITTADSPHVILVVGVNGVGKTTTIAKLARRFADMGKNVLLGAGDTYRAAAIEQLEVWANKIGVDLIKHKTGSDPAAVAFDALQAAKARRVDVLIIDTAGRLHTKSNLMDELVKIKRVLHKGNPGAPQEVLLVLDATTGQNAVVQAKLFGDAVGVTGIVLTKLDGTAKGGIVVAVKSELDIPVKMIGIGEGMEDLKIFDADEFVEALFD